MSKVSDDFIPLQIAVLTVSARRNAQDDTSGDYLREATQEAGHHIVANAIVKENRYQIQAQVTAWIASETVQVILINGGTGFTADDVTPEAISPLFDRSIDGFGELFRMVSYEDIGTATIQSRAVAGLVNQTVIFAVPGSTRACRTAWERIIQEQLDARQKPCNFFPI
ncbi:MULTISPECIES: molybdenum cofactor biosynthesis protein B [Symbiopectobacterium]|uniref:molybdenum cofactor biosynthesis protein B n=1 Tax=Candidatus Symbiopectobacterium sp. PLON1 TaxID=2794575 RepID=UPI001A2460EE|nr:MULTISPECIES: molybdenum cofactor biosynthesis protein B [Symbiopectobacterium]MBG6247703.1 molybdenum cofactor biosynthesis protein B [Candidatus Symbiopectobacterium sp. PLON1]MBT9429251.1 molybdenum cofactor biosynthesis protein B [Candidatus Symbiopectobacterium endolongispinus]